MSASVRHLTITLDRDYRDDEIQGIVTALKQLRAVADVQSHVVSYADHLARRVARSELQRRIWEAIDRVFDDKAGNTGGQT